MLMNMIQCLCFSELFGIRMYMAHGYAVKPVWLHGMNYVFLLLPYITPLLIICGFLTVQNRYGSHLRLRYTYVYILIKSAVRQKWSQLLKSDTWNS